MGAADFWNGIVNDHAAAQAAVAPKAQHTPGPWVVETHHRQGHDRMVACWYVLTPHNRVGIAVQPAFSDDTNAEANARLIAAAPELSEAVAMSTAELMRAADFIEANTAGVEGRRLIASLRSQCDFNRSIHAKARGEA